MSIGLNSWLKHGLCHGRSYIFTFGEFGVKLLKIDKKYIFFIILIFGYLQSNLMRVSGVVLLPPLAGSMGLTASGVGFLSSLFFYAYGVSYGFWGVLVDENGPFTCCGISLVIAAAGAFVMAFASSAFVMGVGRALSGLGMSSMFTGLLIYCAYSFSRESYPTLVSICLMVSHSGTIIAVAPLGWGLDLIGARGVFCALGISALVPGFLLLSFRRHWTVSKCNDNSRWLQMAKRTSGQLAETARYAWNCRPLRVVMLTWASTASAIAALQGLWAVTWVRSVTGADQNIARLCATLISVGLVAGPAAGGIVFKFCGQKHENRFFFGCCLLNQMSWILWMVAPHFNKCVLPLFSISGFLIGFFNGCGYVFMGDAVRSLVPLNKNAGAIGVVNMLIYLGVVVFQWGTGFILDYFPAKEVGCYIEKGFLLGFGIILLFQGWSFFLITKIKSFR